MKIAIISPTHYFNRGGTENYLRLCYENWLKKNHDITEYVIRNDKSNDHNTFINFSKIKKDKLLLGWKPHSMVWGGTYKKNKMEQIYNNHDVVIIHTPLPPKKWLGHHKTILVQHFDVKWYAWNNKPFLWSLGHLLTSFFFNVGTIRNAFKFASNNVFSIEETCIKNKQINFYIPLPGNKLQSMHLKMNKRENFVWIARLFNVQKNVKTAIEITNKNHDVRIYGTGHDQWMIKKYLNNQQQYCGAIAEKQVANLLKSAKCLLLTSNYEGFPFTIVEALSNGTPVILFDTFNSAHFFAKSQAVFLIKKGDIQTFNEKIAWLRNLSAQEYNKISQNGVAFAQKHLSKEAFWENWDKVLAKFQVR